MTILSGFILIAIAFGFRSADTQSQCYTPTGLSGTCVDITDCGELLTLLSIRRTEAQTKLLQDSRCGFVGAIPKVCCPVNVAVEKRISQRDIDILPQTCGQSEGTVRIVGGNETDLGEYPWMALIEYRSKLTNLVRAYCGGALITAQYVLTAAHCIQIDQTKTSLPLNVRLGEHDTRTEVDCRETPGGGIDCNDPPVIVPIASFVAHPQYNKRDVRRRNDIGLIRMQRPVTFSDFVKPICLPTSTLQTSGQQDYFVAGWGQTEKDPRSFVKLDIKVHQVGDTACQRAYTGPMYGVDLWDKQTCAGGEKDVDSCGGDSGGPLMLRNTLMRRWEMVGIVSFGPTDCGQKGIPGIYTKVFSYRPWILSQLKP